MKGGFNTVENSLGTEEAEKIINLKLKHFSFYAMPLGTALML